MTYAGLTISDKPALLDAKSKGYDSAYLNFNGYPERVMVDLALAQIAEMESAEKPLTWNERINQMTLDEKAKWLYDLDVCRVSSISIDECNSYRHCIDCMKNMLAGPYTEGANQWASTSRKKRCADRSVASLM